MEIATLTAFLSPFLPTLLKLGGKAVEKATESASGKFGEATFAKAQAVWAKLSPKVEAKEAAKEAAIDVANNPEDEDSQAALRVQLKKLLAQDEELKKAIEQILKEDAPDGTSGTQIVQNVTGDRNQVIGQVNGGNVFGNITSGELTPAETARRVAAIERFRERDRQIWDSLTPDEKANHDAQFEELYRLLAESRS
ncbi:MAG: hypothetical protein ACEQSC_01240 [Candidatus Nanopelagicaceae bacterium]